MPLCYNNAKTPAAAEKSGRDAIETAEAFGASDWLSLAAAPTFAIMALLTVIGGSSTMFCSAMGDGSMLSGMVPMYLLMSMFHLSPWLKLLADRRAARPS